MHNNKKILIVMIAGLVGFSDTQAWAVTRSMQAKVAFVMPLDVGVVSEPQFGKVQMAEAATYVLDTVGHVSGSGVAIAQTGATAGKITLAGGEDQTVGISAGNYRADNGIMPAGARCSYGAARTVSCNDTSLASAPSAGRGTLLAVGLEITTVPGQAGGIAAPGFDLIVVYN